jgi:Domain of unknown function (DUF4832)/Domain of unknown function (DUF4874)
MIGMKSTKFFLTVFASLILVACNITNPKIVSITPAKIITINFEPSLDDFPNPERGFFAQSDFNQNQNSGLTPQTVEELKAIRVQNLSLLRMYYVLEPWRDAVLPQVLLDRLELDFSRAREAGIKMIPRFAYNFGMFADASQTRILAHLEQLKPVLRKNADVIAFMEAGFVGAWGEWHSSTNGLMNSDGSVNDASRAIVEKELAILPSTRTIALRTPSYKFAITGNTALIADQAFDGSSKARIAAHNDCFLASENNWGTYKNRTLEMDFYHQDNLFVAQGGETCNSAADAQPYIGCTNTLTEMAYLRYSTLNIEYEPGVLNGWATGGCMNEIKQRLGYRLRFLSAKLPDRVKPGSSLTISFSVKNDGFAAPYNPRLLELRLEEVTTGKVVKVKMAGGRMQNQDPRFWQPAQTYLVNLEVGVPANLSEGDYRVWLALPDPEPNLYARAEYAIRFANKNTWQASGVNALQHNLKVDTSTVGTTYTGSSWLQ